MPQAQQCDVSRKLIEPFDKLMMARLIRGGLLCDESDRSAWFEYGSLHFVQARDSLPVGNSFEFLARQNFSFQFVCIFNLPIFDPEDMVRPSTNRSIFSCRYRNRTTRELTRSSVAAPMIPPVTLLSSPMMAFWTVFESVSRTTKIKRIKLRELALYRQDAAR